MQIDESFECRDNMRKMLMEIYTHYTGANEARDILEIVLVVLAGEKLFEDHFKFLEFLCKIV